MRHPAVPVIMYHSIGRVDPAWAWNYLTCPWQVFEGHLKWLKRMRFHTILLGHLYDYRKDGKKLHSRSMALTFDDGYLDNWVFAYPLLKKYGFRATLFINPEFVSPNDVVRKNLEDVWQGRAALENLEAKGFLSWKEIEIMEREGVVDVQSHTMSHTWYFCSDEIIDFHFPGNNRYPWMSWNVLPDRKHWHLNENQEDAVPYGTPIYKNERSLGMRRYFEDSSLTEFLQAYAEERGPDFFKAPDWRQELFSRVDNYRASRRIRDRYETDREQKRRFEYELRESKRILEEKLDKEIEFLCWPGGAATDTAIELSREMGYKAYTCCWYKEKGKNAFGEDPSKIYRIGAPGLHSEKGVYYFGGMALLVLGLGFHRTLMARAMFKAIKSLNIFLIKAGIRK